MNKKNKSDSQTSSTSLTKKSLFDNSIIVGALIGVVVFLAFSVLFHFKTLDKFELITLEWRFKQFHHNSHASKNCVVLAIDDLSVKALGQWPWSRGTYVKVLEALKLYGVKSVAFDLFFPNRNKHDLQGDIDFANEVKSFKNVIVGIIVTPLKKKQLEEMEEVVENTVKQFKRFSIHHKGELNTLSVEDIYKSFIIEQNKRVTEENNQNETPVITLLKPYKELFRSLDSIGLVNITSDTLKVVDAPIIIKFGGDYYPSLALSSYLMSLDNKQIRQSGKYIILGNKQKIPTVEKSRFVINWYAPKKGTKPYVTVPIFEVINAYDTLQKLSTITGLPIQKVQDKIDFYYENDCDDYQKSYTQKCSKELISFHNLISDKDYEFIRDDFKGKYVFIGVSDTSIGIKDYIKTPLLDSIPGVYMHANIVDNFLQNDFIKKTSSSITLLIMFVLALCTGITVLGVKNPKLSISIGFIYLLYFLVPLFLFEKFNVWTDMIYTECTILLVFCLAVGYQWMIVDRDKHKIRKVFSNFLAPQILNEVLSDPSKVELGGERKEISILFSDIRGFTTISEKNTPEGVVKFLNEYFDAMVEEIMKTDGAVDKFIGDAIMAFWGAPVKCKNHAELAVKAALGMAEALDKLKIKWSEEGKDYPEINIGIGINTGEAVVGIVGSSKTKSYTAIGDSVNLASRLEGLNKNYPPEELNDKNIIISEFTYQQVKDIFDVKYLGEETVKGKHIAVPIYRVNGIKGGKDE